MQNAANSTIKPSTVEGDKHPTNDATQAISTDHATAALHHEQASKSHKEAVKCHEAGDHKAAAACADKAHEHSVKAAEASKQCTTKTAAVQAAKPIKS